MVKIIGSRCSGKTYNLMMEAKKNNAIIACSNPEYMQKKAYEYGITGVEFVSYNKCVESENTYKPIYIDNLDAFAQRICPSLCGFALSTD